jgi:hypothetical protein
MLTVKFRHTGRDETLILPVSVVEVRPKDAEGYVVEVVHAEGYRQTYEVSNNEEDFNVAFVEGAGGATTQVIRPKPRNGGGE